MDIPDRRARMSVAARRATPAGIYARPRRQHAFSRRLQPPAKAGWDGFRVDAARQHQLTRCCRTADWPADLGAGVEEDAPPRRRRAASTCRAGAACSPRTVGGLKTSRRANAASARLRVPTSPHPHAGSRWLARSAGRAGLRSSPRPARWHSHAANARRRSAHSASRALNEGRWLRAAGSNPAVRW